MTQKEAIEDLRDTINTPGAPCHAVLFHNSVDGYYVSLHAGFAGNCCCDWHKDFVWREEVGYTPPENLEEIITAAEQDRKYQKHWDAEMRKRVLMDDKRYGDNTDPSS